MSDPRHSFLLVYCWEVISSHMTTGMDSAVSGRDCYFSRANKRHRNKFGRPANITRTIYVCTASPPPYYSIGRKQVSNESFGRNARCMWTMCNAWAVPCQPDTIRVLEFSTGKECPAVTACCLHICMYIIMNQNGRWITLMFVWSRGIRTTYFIWYRILSRWPSQSEYNLTIHICWLARFHKGRAGN